MSAGEPRLFARLRTLAAAGPIVVAHRGDSGSFPENTVPAFAAAVAAGAAMVEFDVQQTADGVLVCLHDDTLARTTDAGRVLGTPDVAIGAVRAADLARLDAGSWRGPQHAGIRVPTLAEALPVIQGGSIAMIEHKTGDPAALVALLRRLDLVEDVVVQSFAWDFVARVHSLEPAIALGALGEGALTAERLAALPATHARLVHWNVDDLRAEDVERLHQAGHLVCVYTANSDAELVGAARIGIDAITTNHPARLRALAARGLARRAP